MKNVLKIRIAVALLVPTLLLSACVNQAVNRALSAAQSAMVVDAFGKPIEGNKTVAMDQLSSLQGTFEGDSKAQTTIRFRMAMLETSTGEQSAALKLWESVDPKQLSASDFQLLARAHPALVFYFAMPDGGGTPRGKRDTYLTDNAGDKENVEALEMLEPYLGQFETLAVSPKASASLKSWAIYHWAFFAYEADQSLGKKKETHPRKAEIALRDARKAYPMLKNLREEGGVAGSLAINIDGLIKRYENPYVFDRYK